MKPITYDFDSHLDHNRQFDGCLVGQAYLLTNGEDYHNVDTVRSNIYRFANDHGLSVRTKKLERGKQLVVTFIAKVPK